MDNVAVHIRLLGPGRVVSYMPPVLFSLATPALTSDAMLTIPRTIRAAVLAVVAALAVASPAAAQFSGGIKGGMGQSSYTGTSEFAWKLSGPNSTAFVNWSTLGRFSGQFEFGESRRLGVSTAGGSKLTFSGTSIDFLLLSKYSFGKKLGVSPFVLAGPTLAYNLQCGFEFVTGSLISNTPCTDSAGFRKIDYGFAMAAGINWTVGRATMGVEARGRASFGSVVLETESSRNVAWSVLAGVEVPLHFNFFGRGRQPTGVPTMPGVATLEPISVGTISDPRSAGLPELSGLTGAGASNKRISVTAVDADARSLLIAIAREAGISLVVSNDVRRRVSVSFKDVAPDDAIRAIIADAGLSIAAPPSSRTLPAVVFYQLPVSVNEVPAETIAARFGVSAELAKWLVDSRPATAAARPDKP